MPELPEVETIARGLARALVGVTFGEVRASRPGYVVAPPPSVDAGLRGRRVERVERHGKQLILRLDEGFVHVHLGMSGQISVAPADAPLATHTHFRVALAGSDLELRLRDPRRFGGVRILPVAPPDRLGPDALAIRLPEFRALLARGRQVKALLLDQGALAGLGNIYVDEILWAARVHPQRAASSLPAATAAELHRHMRRILAAAIRAGGSTIRDYRSAEGREGAYQHRHRVWGREGLPCVRCGARIARLVVAGRSSHVCPRCQRRPRPRRRQRGGPSSSRRRKAASSSRGIPSSSAFRRFEPASSPATT